MLFISFSQYPANLPWEKHYLEETCLAEVAVCCAGLPGHACAQVSQEETSLTNQSQKGCEEQMEQETHPAGAGTWRHSSHYSFCAKQNGLKCKRYKSHSMALESVNRGCQIYTNLQVNLCDKAWKTTSEVVSRLKFRADCRNNHWLSSLLCIFQHQAVTFVFRGPQAALNRIL